MGEFFKGWQRKLGCVTLVMSVTLLAGWLTSLVYHDDAYYPITRTNLVWAGSDDGILCIGYSVASTSDYYPLIGGRSRFDHGDMHGLRNFIQKLRRILAIGNVGVFGQPDSPQIKTAYVVVIPYWIAVPSLTGLSAWLILWKPRKRARPAQQVVL